MNSEENNILGSSENTTVIPLPNIKYLYPNYCLLTNWVDNSDYSSLEIETELIADSKKTTYIEASNSASMEENEYSSIYEIDLLQNDNDTNSTDPDDRADKTDYWLAAASGTVSAIIDMLLIGEFTL